MTTTSKRPHPAIYTFTPARYPVGTPEQVAAEIAETRRKLDAVSKLSKSAPRSRRSMEQAGIAALETDHTPTGTRTVVVRISYLSMGGERLVCETDPMTPGRAAAMVHDLSTNPIVSCSARVPPMPRPEGATHLNGERFVRFPSQLSGEAHVTTEDEPEIAPVVVDERQVELSIPPAVIAPKVRKTRSRGCKSAAVVTPITAVVATVARSGRWVSRDLDLVEVVA